MTGTNTVIRTKSQKQVQGPRHLWIRKKDNSSDRGRDRRKIKKETGKFTSVYREI